MTIDEQILDRDDSRSKGASPRVEQLLFRCDKLTLRKHNFTPVRHQRHGVHDAKIESDLSRGTSTHDHQVLIWGDNNLSRAPTSDATTLVGTVALHGVSVVTPVAD